MNVASPHETLSPTLDMDVLVVLANTADPLTGREVARLVRRGAPRSVQYVLNRLVEHGIVLRERGGNSQLHTLNRDHVSAPAVEALANIRTEFLSRLRDRIGGWATPPVHASMFGSAARADGDTTSDIDLFLVRPRDVDEDDDAWDSQLNDLSERVHAWTGNHARVVSLGAADLPQLLADAPPVLSSLRSDGIDLAGTPLRRLLKAAA